MAKETPKDKKTAVAKKIADAKKTAAEKKITAADPGMTLPAEKVITESGVEIPQKPKKGEGLYVIMSKYQNLKQKIAVTDTKHNEVNKYCQFRDCKYATKDKQEIEALEKLRKLDEELSPTLRTLMSLDDFLALTSPERLYIPYEDKSLHIAEVRRGLEIAREHGWVPKYSEVMIINTSKSKVRQGSAVTAGSVTL